jgi:hypothetical protein
MIISNYNGVKNFIRSLRNRIRSIQTVRVDGRNAVFLESRHKPESKQAVVAGIALQLTTEDKITLWLELLFKPDISGYHIVAIEKIDYLINLIGYYIK